MQHRQPLRGGREAVAVGKPLLALPARADSELHPTAADRVEGPRHLRHERRIAEAVADHDVAEPHAPRVSAASAVSAVNDSNVISSVGFGTVWK